MKEKGCQYSKLHIPAPNRRVVVLGTRGFPNVQGGVESHCENLYPIITGQGWDITVLTRENYVDSSINSYGKVKLVPVSCPKNKFLEAIVHTLKGIFIAKRIGCDILHIHGIGPSLCVPLARLLGLRVVVTHHGPDYLRKKWNRTAKLFLKTGEMCACRYANQLICISKTIAADIKNRFKRDAVVIPNGVIIPRPAESKKILKRFGLEEGRYFLAVGRFVPEKGFIDLIDAFALFKNNCQLEENKGFKLAIAGDADHEDKYSLSVKQKAAEIEGVVLTGRLGKDDLNELYSHAHTFILPSYYEGLPIALLEAMSYGLGCVVSDIPANREVKLDKWRYFRPADVTALCERLKDSLRLRLTQEDKKRQINYIREYFNWEYIANNTINVYLNLVK